MISNFPCRYIRQTHFVDHANLGGRLIESMGERKDEGKVDTSRGLNQGLLQKGPSFINNR